MSKRIRIELDVKDKGSVQVKKFATTTDKSFDKIRASAKKLNASFKSMASSFKKVGASVVIATTAFSYFTKKVLDGADDIAKLADSLSISTDELQNFQFAAKIAGIESSSLEMALRFLVKGISDSKSGVGMLTTALKDNQGLIRSLQDTKNPADAMKVALEAIKDSGYDAGLAMTLFGSRAGLALVNLARSYEASIKLAKKFGIAIDDNLLRGAEEANDAMALLGAVLKDKLYSAILMLAPEITKIAIDIATWVNKNKELIKTKTKEWFDNVKDAMESLKEPLKIVLDNLTLFKNVILILIGLTFAKWLTSVGSALAIIGKSFIALVSAIGGVILAIGIFTIKAVKMTEAIGILDNARMILYMGLKSIGKYIPVLSGLMNVLTTRLIALVPLFGALGVAAAALGVAFAAWSGWKIGKMIDGWMQKFTAYRVFMVKFVDNIMQMYIVLGDIIKHPFGGTAESQAALKAELAAHKVIIDKWLKDIRTQTTHGVVILPEIVVTGKKPAVGGGIGEVGGTIGTSDPVPVGISDEVKQQLQDAVDKKKEMNRQVLIDKMRLWRQGEDAFGRTMATLATMREADAIKEVEQMKKKKDLIAANAEAIKALWTDVANQGINEFASGFADIVTGAQTAKEAFADMARSMSRWLVELAVQQMILNALRSTSWGASMGFKDGGITPEIPGAASGAVFNGPSSGYPVMMHGNEAVIPLKNGKVPVEMGGGTSGGITNNININVTPNKGTDEEARQYGNEIGRAVKAEVNKIIIDNKRSGGILNRQQSGVY